ncbi:Lactation elevated protein 1 [Hordeum vulgare]|nr:Lactation elevated protein 1 [Hordeum vulgare]
MFPTMPFNGVASIAGEVFDEIDGSGSNNVAAKFMKLLDTNVVDIDQSPIAGFNYNEMEGGVDDHGGGDDGPRNLNKPDDDKKAKEKIKREHKASSLRDKKDAMVQSNELMLEKTLETKIELADKKA